MADLESIKAILHSKYIDSSNVKPYTGLHINTSGKREEKKNKNFCFQFTLMDEKTKCQVDF